MSGTHASELRKPVDVTAIEAEPETLVEASVGDKPFEKNGYIAEPSNNGLLENFMEGLVSSAYVASAYTALHIVTSALLRRSFGNERWSRMGLAHQIEFTERAVSIVNASVCGSAGVAVLFGKTFDRDVVRPYPRWVHRSLAAMTGYMIYNTAALFFQPKQRTSTYIHHVFAIAGGLASMTFRQAVYFPSAVLFSEFSLLSVYLVHFLSRLHVPPNHPLFRNALLFRLVSVLLTRSFLVQYTLFHGLKSLRAQIQKEEGRKDVSVMECIIKMINSVHPIVMSGLVCNWTIFMALNGKWTWDLLKGYVKGRGKGGFL